MADALSPGLHTATTAIGDVCYDAAVECCSCPDGVAWSTVSWSSLARGPPVAVVVDCRVSGSCLLIGVVGAWTVPTCRCRW